MVAYRQVLGLVRRVDAAGAAVILARLALSLIVAWQVTSLLAAYGVALALVVLAGWHVALLLVEHRNTFR